MKNKIISLAIMTASLFTMTGCLDMEPVSSITDKNMWESEGQFTSFVYGVHSRLRENSFNKFVSAALLINKFIWLILLYKPAKLLRPGRS